MESFLILKCLSSAAHTMSLMALDVPGMHLSMSIVHSTNVSLLRGAGGAVSARATPHSLAKRRRKDPRSFAGASAIMLVAAAFCATWTTQFLEAERPNASDLALDRSCVHRRHG
jgi:hypothetical protein